jgi:hypothetical protein
MVDMVAVFGIRRRERNAKEMVSCVIVVVVAAEKKRGRANR